MNNKKIFKSFLVAFIIVPVMVFSACSKHTHDWGGYQTAIAPTCTTAGTEVRTCHTNAQHTETRSVNALGHDWETTGTLKAAATCTAAAVYEFTCKRDGCTAEKDEPVGDELGHDWDGGILETAATCVSPAVHKFSCIRGCEKNELVGDVNPSAHNIQNGTCTLCGYVPAVSKTFEDFAAVIANPLGGNYTITCDGETWLYVEMNGEIGYSTIERDHSDFRYFEYIDEGRIINEYHGNNQRDTVVWARESDITSERYLPLLFAFGNLSSDIYTVLFGDNKADLSAISTGGTLTDVGYSGFGVDAFLDITIAIDGNQMIIDLDLKSNDGGCCEGWTGPYVLTVTLGNSTKTLPTDGLPTKLEAPEVSVESNLEDTIIYTWKAVENVHAYIISFEASNKTATQVGIYVGWITDDWTSFPHATDDIEVMQEGENIKFKITRLESGEIAGSVTASNWRACFADSDAADFPEAVITLTQPNEFAPLEELFSKLLDMSAAYTAVYAIDGEDYTLEIDGYFSKNSGVLTKSDSGCFIIDNQDGSADVWIVDSCTGEILGHQILNADYSFPLNTFFVKAMSYFYDDSLNVLLVPSNSYVLVADGVYQMKDLADGELAEIRITENGAEFITERNSYSHTITLDFDTVPDLSEQMPVCDPGCDLCDIDPVDEFAALKELFSKLLDPNANYTASATYISGLDGYAPATINFEVNGSLSRQSSHYDAGKNFQLDGMFMRNNPNGTTDVWGIDAINDSAKHLRQELYSSFPYNTFTSFGILNFSDIFGYDASCLYDFVSNPDGATHIYRSKGCTEEDLLEIRIAADSIQIVGEVTSSWIGPHTFTVTITFDTAPDLSGLIPECASDCAVC